MTDPHRVNDKTQPIEKTQDDVLRRVRTQIRRSGRRLTAPELADLINGVTDDYELTSYQWARISRYVSTHAIRYMNTLYGPIPHSTKGATT